MNVAMKEATSAPISVSTTFTRTLALAHPERPLLPMVFTAEVSQCVEKKLTVVSQCVGFFLEQCVLTMALNIC